MKLSALSKGFTFIEIFITMGILAILAGIVFFVFNPVRGYQVARDAERMNVVISLSEALAQCIFDNNGKIPEAIAGMVDGASYIIGSDTEGCEKNCSIVETQSECFDISQVRCVLEKPFVPVYISDLPIDPDTKKWSKEKIGYYISKTSGNDITLGACNPEKSIIKVLKEF
ncbi:MAG: hypothetical protein US74_C0004G0007 [Parcubacteria group bacterium GW2011_GWA2_38_13]|nr:MAG: hypothetical protein US74_C0004G0007 [Parcubacteria group bacterium GW2011_GWA2_38_13]